MFSRVISFYWLDFYLQNLLTMSSFWIWDWNTTKTTWSPFSPSTLPCGSQPCLDFETTKFLVADDTSSQWSRTSGRECQTPAVSSSCVMSCIISLQQTCPSCLVSSVLAAAPFCFSVPWTFQGWSRCMISAFIVPSFWRKLHVPFPIILFRWQPKANSFRGGFCFSVLGSNAVVMHMLGKLSIIELHLQLYRGLHSLVLFF